MEGSTGRSPATSRDGSGLRQQLLQQQQQQQQQQLLESRSSGNLARRISRKSRSSLLSRSRSDLHEVLSWLEGPEAPEEQQLSGPGPLPEQPSEGQQAQQAQAQVQPEAQVQPWLFLRPVGLFGSTLAAAISMLSLQRPLLKSQLGQSCSSGFSLASLGLSAVTMACMWNTARSDPGQLHGEAYEAWLAGGPLPRRAHKNWLYTRPIRRFDHYCRWIMNCIGLMNHREFMVMTTGIVLSALLGAWADLLLLLSYPLCSTGWDGSGASALALHALYSLTVLYFALPILRLHVGLVSRNELAKEWKRDDNYIIRMPPVGDPISVNELDVHDYNFYFDNFEYDATRIGWQGTRSTRGGC